MTEEKKRRCPSCGERAVTSRRENYAYSESGLDNVTLCDIEVRYCSECGERMAVIPMMEGLHELLRTQVAMAAEPLTASTVRFLRTSLGMSKVQFARELNVDKSAVGRWESGATAISPMGDRLIRIIAMKHKPVDSYLGDMIDTEPVDGELTIRVEKKSKRWAALKVA